MDTATTDPTPAPRERRVDARRNLEAILEAARALLAADPTVSMGAIAAAAGVHRATVHRHFPAREDLLLALHERADRECLAAVEAARDGGGSPGTAVAEVTQRWLDIIVRYRLPELRAVYAPVKETEVRRLVVAGLEALFAEGAAAGEVRADVPTPVLVTLWVGLLISASQVIVTGQADAEAAAAHVLALVRP